MRNLPLRRIAAALIMGTVLVLIVYINWPDALRIIGIGLFAFVLAQALVINWAVHALRGSVAAPPAMLAWHVHAVTLYALGMHGTIALLSFERIGNNSLSWLSLMLVFLGVVGNAAMYLIGRITAARQRVARDFEGQINNGA